MGHNEIAQNAASPETERAAGAAGAGFRREPGLFPDCTGSERSDLP